MLATEIPLMVRDFPNLSDANATKKSPFDPSYNCAAWAVGRAKNCWWDYNKGHPNAYWPPGVPRTGDITSYIASYEYHGYERCDNGQIENGWKKIAIYASLGEFRHAAKVISETEWHSKIGNGIDIVHSPDALTGPCYGWPTTFMRKRIT